MELAEFLAKFCQRPKEQGKLEEGESVRYFGAILILLTASVASAAASTTATFPGGEPGCLRLVGSRSLSPAQVKSLPHPCANFHKNYSMAVHQLSVSPKTFPATVLKTLSEAEKSGSLKTPYDALLLAVLTNGLEELPAIQTYSEFEKKKNVYFKYASAAAERLANGSCKNFTQPAYEEICKGSDQILSRMVALNQPLKETGKGKKK